MEIGLIPMIKYDERLTRISQEEYLQIIRDNANTTAVIVGTNLTVGLDSATWVNQLFAQADRYKESLEPWRIESDGGDYFTFSRPQGGRYRIRIGEDLKKVRRYYFKNEEHHLLIRVARNLSEESAHDNHPPVRVSVLKYLFEE